MSKDKSVDERLKICGLLLALAVVDDKSEAMWGEFYKAISKDFDELTQKVSFHYGEVILNTTYDLDKFVLLVTDNNEKKAKKAKKKGVKKNARR